MKLKDFFGSQHISNIQEKIRSISNSKVHLNSGFEYEISESNCKLTFKYQDLIEKDLISINLHFLELASNSNLRHYDLDFRNYSFRWIDKRSQFNLRIGLKLEKIGSKNQAHEIKITSTKKQELNVEIIDSKCLKISLIGKMNFVDLSNCGVNNLNLNTDFDVMSAKKIGRANNGGGAVFGIHGGKGNELRIEDIRGYKEIELADSDIEAISLKLYECNSLTIRAITSEKIGLIDGNCKTMFICSLFTDLGELRIANNVVDMIKFRDLKFTQRMAKGFSKKLKMKPINPINTFSILFANNEVQKFLFQNIKWDYDAIIDHEYREYKRDFILKVKKFYGSIQDVPNEKLFKSFEKIWYFKNRKKSFPLFMSYHSNKFGLSVSKPLILLILAIVLQFGVFYFFASIECRHILLAKWSIFSHLLNPTHRTSLFLNALEECTVDSRFFNIITVVDNFFRLIIGYLIFQFIDAFRYKYNLGK